MPEHPESFPVNALVPIEGTPLEKNDVGQLSFSILRDLMDLAASALPTILCFVQLQPLG
jgi:biotin synthase-like enzyme